MEPTLPKPEMRDLKPVPEVQFTSGNAAEVAPNTKPEQSHESDMTTQVASTPTPQDDIPITDTPQQAVATAKVAVNNATDNPIIADDVDVIEKEWVDKAKKIVESTKNDPYEQEKQVSHLQADYLLKRYNKQIKTPE